MSYDMLIDEPLRIGIIGIPEDVGLFKRLCPEAICYHYESLEEFSLWGEQDEVDVLVIDVTYLERKESQRVRGCPVLHGEYEALKSLSEHFPTILLADPESVIPAWIMGSATVLEKPVDDLLLMRCVADYEEEIQLKRLRRMFQKVAAAFVADIKVDGGKENEM